MVLDPYKEVWTIGNDVDASVKVVASQQVCIGVTSAAFELLKVTIDQTFDEHQWSHNTNIAIGRPSRSESAR